MRISPKYNNLCWNRNGNCINCDKEYECDQHYFNGNWYYSIKNEYKPQTNIEPIVRLRPLINGIYDRKIAWMFNDVEYTEQ